MELIYFQIFYFYFFCFYLLTMPLGRTLDYYLRCIYMYGTRLNACINFCWCYNTQYFLLLPIAYNTIDWHFFVCYQKYSWLKSVHQQLFNYQKIKIFISLIYSKSNGWITHFHCHEHVCQFRGILILLTIWLDIFN